MGVGFVKQVGFKPGMEERGSYGWAESVVNQEEEVMGEEIGEVLSLFFVFDAMR